MAVRGTLGPSIVLLPVLVVALYAFVLGCALAVSVLHAYFRDVAPILGAALLPWFFVSPIFFEPAGITENGFARRLLTWGNPVAPFIEAVRDVDLRRRRGPAAATLAYVLVAAVLALVAGRALFSRLQRELAVVV